MSSDMALPLHGACVQETQQVVVEMRWCFLVCVVVMVQKISLYEQ